MSRNTPQPDPEDIHKDLLATMAASRELGPEMDKALVESYMERHPELKGAPQQAQALTQPQPVNRPDILGFSGMGVMMIGYITLLIVTHGELWWMFWPMMAWGGWRWGNGGGRHAAHQQMRQARWEARMNRYGMPYVRVGGPDDAQQSQPQQPQQPPAIPPAPPSYAPPSPPLATPPLATPPAPSGEAPVHAPPTLPPINPAG